jgi:hypothetical protein
MPHNYHAPGGTAPGPAQLQIYALCDSTMPGGNRGRPGAGGGALLRYMTHSGVLEVGRGEGGEV